MRTSGITVVLVLAVIGIPSVVLAQKDLLPATAAPALVLDPGGPSAPVTALAFSQDSSTLYVAGLDKVVRRYAIQNGKFVPAKPANPIRLPIGPGNAGAVNSLAVSPDGKWLAVGGRAPFREEAWFGDKGGVIRSNMLTADQKKDVGVVYLIDPANPARGKVIRGAAGEVRALAFATPGPAAGPVLVTASLEWAADGRQIAFVRVFDVNSGKELAAPLTGLPATPTFPGLAAWIEGKAIRVAIAWPNKGTEPGDLIVWEPTAKKTHRFPDGSFNLPLALRIGPDGKPEDIWSGGFVNLGKPGQTGQLSIRAIADLDKARDIAFPTERGQFFLPRSVAIGGKSIAVLLEIASGKQERPAQLRLLSANGEERARTTLTGLSRAFLPTMKLSPDGKWIAVAGFEDNRVEIYDAAGKPVQKIAGAAGGHAGVAFLKGDRLWVGGTGDSPARGGLVFDFKARQAKGNAGKEAVDAPAGSRPEWKFDPAKRQITGTGAAVPIILREGETPDAVAFLPAGPAWAKDAGVVIVAHTDRENAVTLVSLFDATTGRRLRQLVGPTQPVRALAVSGSRPLVAAVSADQEAFVWSLVDLPKAEAAIDGLHVANRGKTVVVEMIDANNPALAKFAVGDVVEAVGGPNGKLRAVTQSHEFRDEVGAQPVGSEVRIRVKGKGMIAVKTVRGLGQRGPLFSLWIDPAGDAAADWIGWSPSGPYDASTVAAESRIGWLEATGDPAQPVTFAGVGQYRKRYYKRGILEQLVEKGDLAAAMSALPPPQAPALELAVTPTVEASNGTRIVRDTAARLDINLLDPDDVVVLNGAVLQWRVTGPDGKPGAWQALPIRDRAAAADLAKQAWARGEHTFEATISDVFDPAAAPAVKGSVKISFVPPAPKIATVRVGKKEIKPGEELTVEDESIEIGAEVQAGDGGAAELSLTSSGPRGNRPQSLKSADGKSFGPVTADLNKKSVTVVRLTAVNAKAGDFAKEETSFVEFRVRHVPKPPPVPPPGLKAKLDTPSEEPDAVGGPRIVDTASATVSVTVKADKPIEVLEWDTGDGWKPGKFDAKTKAAAVTVADLEPGKSRTVKVRARMKDGPFATDSVKVVYHPAPPTAVLNELSASVLGSELVIGGTYTRAVKGTHSRIRVVVLSPRSGIREEVPADLMPGPEAGSGTWQVRVRLFPGANKLGLIVANEFKQRARLDIAEIIYRRPPLVIRVAPVKVTEGGIGDIAVRTLTAPDVAPTSLLLNDSPLRVAPPRRLATVLGTALWEVRAASVSVKAREKIPETISLRVANADGRSGAASAVVLAPPPPPKPVPPPVIASIPGMDSDPGKAIRVDQPLYSFRVRATSAKKLIRAEVRYGPPNQVGRPLSLDTGNQVEGEDGFALDIAATPRIMLREGINRIEVIVASSAGEVAREFLVDYRPPPLRVEITGIDTLDPDRKIKARPVVFTPGEIPESTGWLVEIHGRVAWTGDDNPIADDQSIDVVLIANQVMHMPVPLLPREGTAKERNFHSRVFLNAADTNVRIELRSRVHSSVLAQQGLDAVEQMIRCDEPLTLQRLHVLVIGVGIPRSEGPALARHVVQAIGGTVPANRPHFDSGVFQHPAFERAILYVPELGQVDRPSAMALLRHVTDEVVQTTSQPKDDWLNDVILVYFHGRDMVGKDGIRRLHTSRSLRYAAGAGDKYAIRLDELPETPGLRLVLLNVYDPEKNRQNDPSLLAAIPLLRYSWQDAALRDNLLDLFHQAVTRKAKLGDIVDWVSGQVEILNKLNKAFEPLVRVSEYVRERRIGTVDGP